MPDPTNPVMTYQAGIYARQRTIALSLPKCVGVVGCGGVGSWIAYFLALAGVPKLMLWDPDTVESHNLNRLPLALSALGKHKVDAIAELIAGARPDCEVLPFRLPFRCNDYPIGNITDYIDWMVVSTDSAASRRDAYKWAHDMMGIPYIEAAAEGEIGSISRTPPEFSTDEETHPGYASVPAWVGPCCFAATLACTQILHSMLPIHEVIRLGWEGNDIMFYAHRIDPPEPPDAEALLRGFTVVVPDEPDEPPEITRMLEENSNDR